jgi:hypothetical protein
LLEIPVKMTSRLEKEKNLGGGRRSKEQVVKREKK